MTLVGRKRDGWSGVFIAEEDDVGGFLTGTFWASWQTDHGVREEHAGLTADAAIAWGRARSDSVQIRLGVGDYYWAGVGPAPPDTPSWPPPDLPDLVRRRHPELEYLDRTEADPEIEWNVTAWVAAARRDDAPAGMTLSDDVAAVIAGIAERAGATWDSDARDEMLADAERARRAAKRRGLDEYGWTSYGRDAYRLQLTVSASTQQLARHKAAACVDLPAGLQLEELTATPTRPSPQ